LLRENLAFFNLLRLNHGCRMNSLEQSGLDRPIWSALTSNHEHLGYGDSMVRRYHPSVAPFAAISHETPAAYHKLSRLLQPDEHVRLLSQVDVTELSIPQAKNVSVIHQMVATHVAAGEIDDHDVIQLTRIDAKDMLELAQRTKPGPFGTRTHETGRYVGIRDHGRLIAMAGERMQFGRYVEISTVCVDDDWRRRGLAGRLVQVAAKQIAHRGGVPFLHVFNDNVTARNLYERLGFEDRRTLFVTQVARTE
jgi:predicted GNAT family acetyltransferase